MASQGNRRGREVPRERNRFGAIVDSRIRTLRRGSHRAIDKVQLIAVFFLIDVVTDLRTEAEAEGLTRLLTSIETGKKGNRTIALCEFIRIRVRFNRTTELFERTQLKILDVVRVNIGSFRTGRSLRNGGQTIPRNTGTISTILVNEVKDAMVYASLQDRTLLFSSIIYSRF